MSGRDGFFDGYFYKESKDYGAHPDAADARLRTKLMRGSLPRVPVNAPDADTRGVNTKGKKDTSVDYGKHPRVETQKKLNKQRRDKRDKYAAQSDAPNYGPSEQGSGKYCGNCQFIDDDTGGCTLYNFIVNKDSVCDSWAAGSGGNVVPGASSGGTLR
jgi:hypothetical protein